MTKHQKAGSTLAGFAAGTVTGLFGGGGGMVMVPALTLLTDIDEDNLFPTSLSIMLPICVVSLITTAWGTDIPIMESVPYLLGSAGGGLLAALWGKRIPTGLLHRLLGILILWGGIRYLW